MSPNVTPSRRIREAFTGWQGTGTDVSCLLHLDGIRRREGFGPRAIHLAEILANGARPAEAGAQ